MLKVEDRYVKKLLMEKLFENDIWPFFDEEEEHRVEDKYKIQDDGILFIFKKERRDLYSTYDAELFVSDDEVNAQDLGVVEYYEKRMNAFEDELDEAFHKAAYKQAEGLVTTVLDEAANMLPDGYCLQAALSPRSFTGNLFSTTVFIMKGKTKKYQKRLYLSTYSSDVISKSVADYKKELLEFIASKAL